MEKPGRSRAAVGLLAQQQQHEHDINRRHHSQRRADPARQWADPDTAAVKDGARAVAGGEHGRGTHHPIPRTSSAASRSVKRSGSMPRWKRSCASSALAHQLDALGVQLVVIEASPNVVRVLVCKLADAMAIA